MSFISDIFRMMLAGAIQTFISEHKNDSVSVAAKFILIIQ